MEIVLPFLCIKALKIQANINMQIGYIHAKVYFDVFAFFHSETSVYSETNVSEIVVFFKDELITFQDFQVSCVWHFLSWSLGICPLPFQAQKTSLLGFMVLVFDCHMITILTGPYAAQN